ncbi:MAG: 4-phosphopantoate--beta-alanine ligase [Nitrosopumilaceae archaeon]|nr:4-phosphopantoate--beta-alanine ligase [Nitrosopumilaceae archaeon]
MIPKSHSRATSLLIREKLVHGFDNGLVAKEGLIAHGRGETFDYLLGEKTTKNAKKAIKAAALALVLAKSPVISVNGNIAALCAKEIVQLSKTVNAKIEVNLFYSDNKRKQNIARLLKKNEAKEVFGLDPKSSRRISGLDNPRRVVDKDGIYAADTVLVPLEDGDRTLALKKAGKQVITFDLNPLSRTAQTADITIVDNVVRGLKELIRECKKVSKNPEKIQFHNKKNL